MPDISSSSQPSAQPATNSASRQRKVARADNPFRSGSNGGSKKVNVGFAGNTPKATISQQQFFDSNDTDDNHDHSPDRPKTSRGKSHPSPEEFFDYIIPSPGGKGKKTDQANKKKSEFVSYFADDQKDVARPTGAPLLISVTNQQDSAKSETDEKPDFTEEYLLRMHNGDGKIDKKKRVTLAACWLFGSALRI